jgi:hypothetical protein
LRGRSSCCTMDAAARRSLALPELHKASQAPCSTPSVVGFLRNPTGATWHAASGHSETRQVRHGTRRRVTPKPDRCDMARGGGHSETRQVRHGTWRRVTPKPARSADGSSRQVPWPAGPATPRRRRPGDLSPHAGPNSRPPLGTTPAPAARNGGQPSSGLDHPQAPGGRRNTLMPANCPRVAPASETRRGETSCLEFLALASSRCGIAVKVPCMSPFDTKFGQAPGETSWARIPDWLSGLLASSILPDRVEFRGA